MNFPFTLECVCSFKGMYVLAKSLSFCQKTLKPNAGVGFKA